MDPNLTILLQLFGTIETMGYNYPCDVIEAIETIENNNIDQSLLQYPYGSFETFKQYAFARKFNTNENKHQITEKHKQEINKKVRNHEAWIIY